MKLTPEQPMKLTPEQFEALRNWVEAVAAAAAGRAVNRPTPRDDWPERRARSVLTGEEW